MTAPTTAARRPVLVALVDYTLRACLPGKRWAAALIPAAAAVLFGFIASTVDDTAVRAFASVADDCALPPRHAGHLPGHRRRRPRRGGPFGHVRVHLDVPGADLEDRGRPLARRHRSRRPAPSRSRSPLPPSRPARPRAPARSRSPRSSAPRPTSRCSSPSAASPSGRPSGRSPSSSSSSGSSAASSSGIAQLSPSWEALAAFVGLSDAQQDLVRDGIPHGTAALVRLCLISAVALVLTTTKLRSLKLTKARLIDAGQRTGQRQERARGRAALLEDAESRPRPRRARAPPTRQPVFESSTPRCRIEQRSSLRTPRTPPRACVESSTPRSADRTRARPQAGTAEEVGEPRARIIPAPGGWRAWRPR